MSVSSIDKLKALLNKREYWDNRDKERANLGGRKFNWKEHDVQGKRQQEDELLSSMPKDPLKRIRSSPLFDDQTARIEHEFDLIGRGNISLEEAERGKALDKLKALIRKDAVDGKSGRDPRKKRTSVSQWDFGNNTTGNIPKYDKDGVDLDGYRKSGYDKQGYNREGFNKKGFNHKGWNKDGNDKDGHNRQYYTDRYNSKMQAQAWFNDLNRKVWKDGALDPIPRSTVTPRFGATPKHEISFTPDELKRINGDKKETSVSKLKKALDKLNKDSCWTGYVAVGTKMKNGKRVPNCVPKSKTQSD